MLEIGNKDVVDLVNDEKIVSLTVGDEKMNVVGAGNRGPQVSSTSMSSSKPSTSSSIIRRRAFFVSLDGSDVIDEGESVLVDNFSNKECAEVELTVRCGRCLLPEEPAWPFGSETLPIGTT